MYSGAVSRTGFLTFTPSAQRYSYCKEINGQSQDAGALYMAGVQSQLLCLYLVYAMGQFYMLPSAQQT